MYNYIDKKANEGFCPICFRAYRRNSTVMLRKNKSVRGANNMFNKNPKIKNFENIFKLQEQIISSRVSHGYKYKMALFDEALPIPLLYMR